MPARFRTPLKRTFVTLVLPVALLSPVSCGSSDPPPAQLVRLTVTGARNGQASYSHDGRRVAFVSNRSGEWDIYTMAADGTDLRRVTQPPGAKGWPSFTPDGTRLFWYSAIDSTYRIYSSSPGGLDVRPLGEGTADFRPSPSPDGSELLFDRFFAGAGPQHDLMVLDVTTGALRRITTHPDYDADGRWSPDGDWIVFQSGRFSPPDAPFSRMEVFKVRPDGTELTQLTHDGGVNQYPGWSPDGRRIAYTSDRSGNRDIWVMNADGSKPIQVTKDPADDSAAVWAPDGSSLLFSTTRFGGEELCLIRLP